MNIDAARSDNAVAENEVRDAWNHGRNKYNVTAVSTGTEAAPGGSLVSGAAQPDSDDEYMLLDHFNVSAQPTSEQIAAMAKAKAKGKANGSKAKDKAQIKPNTKAPTPGKEVKKSIDKKKDNETERTIRKDQKPIRSIGKHGKEMKRKEKNVN